MIGFIMKHIRRRKYQRESFNARMQMERNAQENVAARLERLELVFKNKTRTK